MKSIKYDSGLLLIERCIFYSTLYYAIVKAFERYHLYASVVALLPLH